MGLLSQNFGKHTRKAPNVTLNNWELTLGNDDFPPGNDDFPLGNDDFPLGNNDFPPGNGNFPPGNLQRPPKVWKLSRNIGELSRYSGEHFVHVCQCSRSFSDSFSNLSDNNFKRPISFITRTFRTTEHHEVTDPDHGVGEIQDREDTTSDIARIRD